MRAQLGEECENQLTQQRVVPQTEHAPQFPLLRRQQLWRKRGYILHKTRNLYITFPQDSVPLSICFSCPSQGIRRLRSSMLSNSFQRLSPLFFDRQLFHPCFLACNFRNGGHCVNEELIRYRGIRYRGTYLTSFRHLMDTYKVPIKCLKDAYAMHSWRVILHSGHVIALLMHF